MSTALNTA